MVFVVTVSNNLVFHLKSGRIRPLGRNTGRLFLFIMRIIINPGTGKQESHSEDNATKAAQIFLEDLNIKDMHFERTDTEVDDRGWYEFLFTKGDFNCKVDFPGIDPEITAKGEPWVSPRIYVDGSSWLWGYGLGIFTDKYKDFIYEKELK